ncbi:GGDEF domain-containing protein [Vibrio sonorensis]|uniref:GGDEF domain-containing protein n=1 Tax=Vibrio sonorensis TaxID=1004316 RepID=UPI0008DAC223|nr:GGDEF domain-containing protein [Vibrio sonorensis]
MKNKKQPTLFTLPLAIFTTLCAVPFIMLMLAYYIEVDSKYDLLFETTTLMVLIYIFHISRQIRSSNRLIITGLSLLLFNAAYDLITEIAYLDRLADQHELIDVFIEDGTLQVAYLFIAFGLTSMLHKVRENAARDELTGLYNRKKLNAIRLEDFDLVYIDIDGLKAINDLQGHAKGDLMLIEFANALNEFTESPEQAFRIGGDEFVVLLHPKRGKVFVEKVKYGLKDSAISFSYGIERSTRSRFFEALEKTDKAMYQMKHGQKKSRPAAD